MPITQYLLTIILLLLWLKFGAFADKPKKKEVENYDYILHNVYDNETRIVKTTYHKYLMVKGGKRLIHLRSCKNKTHIKN